MHGRKNVNFPNELSFGWVIVTILFFKYFISSQSSIRVGFLSVVDGVVDKDHHRNHLIIRMDVVDIGFWAYVKHLIKFH